MVYTKVTWYDGTGGTTATRISAEHLNHLETQYDEVIGQAATWNNHDSRYYLKSTAITTFFSSSFMGKGSSADADLLDGHHASDLLGTGLPVGAIVWWGKDSGTIPSGWAMCNGASGTTDYRDKFVIGTSTTYTVKNFYGAASVTPTTYQVVIGSTALDESTIPSHTHSWAEYYNYYVSNYFAYSETGSARTFTYYASTTVARTTASQGSGTAHTHSGSTVTWNSEANLPPYYALYLIQRLS